MKKRILGFLLAAAMIVSTLPAYATATMPEDGIYFDNFETGTNANTEWYESANANLDASDSNKKTIASSARASVDAGTLKLTAVADAKNAFYVMFANPVTGNLKVSFKIKVKDLKDFVYIAGTSQKGGNNRAHQYLFSLRLLKDSKLVTAGVWHPYNGPDKFIDTKNNALAWTEDKWYSVEVDFNTEGTKKTYQVSVDGIKSDLSNLDNTSWGGLTRFGFKMACEGEIAIDDFKVQKIIPLELTSANITDKEVNVKVDKNFELNFQKEVDATTISNITLAKKNDSTTAIPCTITADTTGKKVTVNPNADLDSLTEYVLTVPITVKSKDGQPLKTVATYNFTTEFVTDYSIESASFADNTFTATINKLTSGDGAVRAKLIVYEKLANGKKRYVNDYENTIPINGSATYDLVISDDIPENYIVSLSLLDDDLKPLCSEVALDKDGAVTEQSENITTEENTVDYTTGIVKIAKKLGTVANVYSTVEVKNENNEVIYFDQIMTGANGSSQFEFVPKKGETATSYKITLNGTTLTEKIEETLAVDYSQFKVSTTKPTIEGTLAGGEELEAKYTYSSVIDDEEGATAYQWYIASTEDGVYSPITDATSKKYTLKDSDENQFIKVSVTPKSALGQAVGTVEESLPVAVKTLPKALNVRIDGTSAVGQTLTGYYEYSHKNGVKQLGSTYEWLIATEVNGTYSKVGDGQSYAVTESDAGKYIKFKVTPKCETEPKEGKAVETAPQLIQTGNSGGGGGNGGGVSPRPSAGGGFVGSGDYKNPEVVKPEEEKPEEKVIFGDIDGHWAKEQIERLFEEGIVTGDEKGNFNPEANVTRAEFTAMMVRLLGLESQKYISMFEDVNSKDWYANVIATAVAYGIVSGDGDSFRPTDGISREEMAVILIRAYEKKIGVVDSGEVSATDKAKISQWALEAVEKAWAMGLVNGFEDGSFAPQDSVTRAQAAVVMVRLLEYIEEV